MKHLAVAAMLLLMGGCVSVNAGHASSKDQQFEPWVLELAARRAEALAQAEVVPLPAPEAVAPIVATRPARTKQVQRPQRSEIRRTAIEQPRSEPMTGEEKVQEATRLMLETARMQQEVRALNGERQSRITERQQENAARRKRLER